MPTPPSDIPYNVAYTEENGLHDAPFDHALELRLMHQWTAYTCQTFSSVWEFWRFQAPLIALEFRYVLDAMLALAALHASKMTPSQWIPMEGRMVSVRDPLYNAAHPERKLSEKWKLPHLTDEEREIVHASSPGKNIDALYAKRTGEMLSVSRAYFDRAIDGHRKAVGNMTVENIEGIYITSILVSFITLFCLSESEDNTILPCLDLRQWFRLARGTTIIVGRWNEYIGKTWIATSGVFYGKPDLTDDDEIFRLTHAAPFERLLTWGEDFESITPEDKDAYNKMVPYIGLIYKGIVDGTDEPLGTCRRIMALPSRCPARFADLVEDKRPRAMVMLAHVFASMKLLAEKIDWFRGVAEQQVPLIYQDLPSAWREMMAWPMAVTSGELDREPRETQIHDILSL